MLRRRSLVFCLLLLVGCGCGSDYEPTELPIVLLRLSAEHIAVIDSLEALDPHPYKIDSRPLLIRIPTVADSVHAELRTLRIEKAFPVRIFALGEARGGEMVDFAWIENIDTGERIWEMTYENSTYAGGDRRNRKADVEMTMPSGGYAVHYRTNESHAFGAWVGEPPEHEGLYGIIIFMVDNIDKIQEAFRQRGL
jgi:hypothetical protein